MDRHESDEDELSGEHDYYRYSEAELERIAQNLERVYGLVPTDSLDARAFGAPLLRSIHRTIFDDVRGFAGKIRCRGNGSERVIVFERQSCHRDDVQAEIDMLTRYVASTLRQLDDMKKSDEYEQEVFRCAVRTHAEIVRIQPFEDGNKRTGRVVLALILKACGMPPLTLDLPRREYLDALGAYVANKNNLDPLVDLHIEAYENSIA